jgi:hypothetical protein
MTIALTGKNTMSFKSGLFVEVDYSILNEIRPYADRVRALSRQGQDLSIDTLITSLLSKHKPLLEITEEEVDLYATSLIFGEY